MQYPTRNVFAAAVHAHRENDGYSSARQVEEIRDAFDNVIGEKIKHRNLDLVKQYLESSVDLPTECYTEADSIMDYYKGKLMDLMTGKLNSYSQSAMVAANSESIDSLQQIGLIASLPKAFRQSVKFDSMLETKEWAQKQSVHFGKSGDSYDGRVEVIASIYSSKWFRHFHTAKDLETNNVVNFSSADSLEIGRKIHIKGRIKDHVDNNVTRLNYVKIVLDDSN
jgi:hypothetical protein